MKLVCKQCNTEIEILETKIQDNELIIKGYCEQHGNLRFYVEVKEGWKNEDISNWSRNYRERICDNG
jgi:hypothetical protein